jgi:hypothetical protein
MLYFAKSVPVVAGERTLRVRRLVEARRATTHAPSIYASVLKAMGIVSMRVPELRRAYMPFPWPRLYEHPHSVATTIINRKFGDEDATFLCPLLHPEREPLTKIQSKLDRLRNDPVEQHGSLRRLVRHSRYPRPIRRAMWAAGLRFSGSLRAGMFGTFAINSVAGLRSRMLQFMTPITTVLYVGSPNKDGEMDVQLAFDHRVYDGTTTVRIAVELERVLNNEIATEIRAGGAEEPPRAAA